MIIKYKIIYFKILIEITYFILKSKVSVTLFFLIIRTKND